MDGSSPAVTGQGHGQRLRALAANPQYQALVAERMRFAWLLTGIMLAVFFGFIVLVAFDKAVLARPLGNGAMTVGIPVGLGVILVGIGLTALYVRRANRDFDPRMRSILEQAENRP